MFIGCTGKVAKYFHCSLVETKEDVFHCWQVTQFNVRGEEILLFMNLYTRFPLFMRDVEGLTIISLQERFIDLFSQVMNALQIPENAITLYLSNANWTYGKILDRSVMSQMNDLAYIYKFNLINGNSGYQDIEASILYADIPCMKANIYPKEKMMEAMQSFYRQNEKVS